MKIAILGTRGVPNYYGGFEQFAQYLSLGLIQQGIEVTVYNSHNHPYQKSTWKGVTINHCYDPEHFLGTMGQFVYDLNCILDSRKRNFDIILQLGYTSSSVWSRLLPRRRSVITTNMDGLEWKRTKYSKNVQGYLQYAEKLAIKFSHYLISDSIGIQKYLKDKYNVESTFIPYGADIFASPDRENIKELDIIPYEYNLLIARLEPENSIEIILDGALEATCKAPFLVIGKHETRYGEYLKNKYKHHDFIKFVGGIYDMEKLNNLRYFSNLYFHGHMVGGTNPSLLEAMAAGALVCAHNNIFNRSILGSDALYFTTVKEASEAISCAQRRYPENQKKIQNNLQKIKSTYSWSFVIQQYVSHFKTILSQNSFVVPAIK